MYPAVTRRPLELEDRVVTRTVQFRVYDVRFWQGQTLLPPHNDPATLAAASSLTLTVHQKEGFGDYFFRVT